MAEKEQSFAHHARTDPMFHGFLFLFGLLLLGLGIWQAVTTRTWISHLFTFGMIWGFVLIVRAELYSTAVAIRWSTRVPPITSSFPVRT